MKSAAPDALDLTPRNPKHIQGHPKRFWTKNRGHPNLPQFAPEGNWGKYECPRQGTKVVPGVKLLRGRGVTSWEGLQGGVTSEVKVQHAS